MASELYGSSNPDVTTVGIPGQIYTNTLTNERWRCVAIYKATAKDIDNTIYFWERIGESIGGSGSTTIAIKYVESLDSNNMIPLRSLDSGTYVLNGYFTSYEGATSTMTFTSGMIVSIIKKEKTSYIQVLYSVDNTIQYLEITDDSVTRKDAKLKNMETLANKQTIVDNLADDNHYPSSKAVYDVIPKYGDTEPTSSTVGVVGQPYFVISADNKVTAMYVCTASSYTERTWSKFELTSNETT